jgi:hypothetical protein
VLSISRDIIFALRSPPRAIRFDGQPVDGATVFI